MGGSIAARWPIIKPTLDSGFEGVELSLVFFPDRVTFPGDKSWTHFLNSRLH